jgi:ABC-type uncharacterized transport system permease subunit
MKKLFITLILLTFFTTINVLLPIPLLPYAGYVCIITWPIGGLLTARWLHKSINQNGDNFITGVVLNIIAVLVMTFFIHLKMIIADGQTLEKLSQGGFEVFKLTIQVALSIHITSWLLVCIFSRSPKTT